MCWHRLANLDFEAKQELDDDEDCREFIDTHYEKGGSEAYKLLFNNHIQQFEFMPIRAFLLVNMPIFNKIEANLTANDNLFVILSEVIYQKLDAPDRDFKLLLACAEKLTNNLKGNLTLTEIDRKRHV